MFIIYAESTYLLMMELCRLLHLPAQGLGAPVPRRIVHHQGEVRRQETLGEASDITRMEVRHQGMLWEERLRGGCLANQRPLAEEECWVTTDTVSRVEVVF